MRYSLEEFESCSLEHSVLPDKVLEGIDKLCSRLGITVSDNRKLRRVKSDPKSDVWEKIKQDVNFKKTVFDEKDEKEKVMSKLKISLNKLNAQNFEKEKENILETIKLLKEGEVEFSEELINIFVNTAMANPLYAKFYVSMLVELCQNEEIINNSFTKRDFINMYKDSLMTINYVDSSEDFNKHCLMNKENDRRKGLYMFIVELVKHEIYDETNLEELFDYQLDLLENNETDKSMVQINEEVVENMNLLFTFALDIVKEQEYFENIKEKVQKCKEKRECIGISKRVLFKFMDMMDKC
jgi:hypothetical protein